MRILNIIRFSAALLAMGTVYSCSQQKDNEPPANVEPPADFAPLTEVSDDKKDLYLIIKNVNSSYWNIVTDGVADAGKELGCNIYFSGTTAETDITGQADLLRTAVENGADAVIFAPNDSEQLSQSVSNIHENGTPIVLVDTAVNTTDYDICYMTDNLYAGQMAAETLISEMKKNGVSEDEAALVAIQIGAVNSPTINERLAGFCQYWAKNAPEPWDIIDEVKTNYGDSEQTVGIAESFFNSYDNIRGVFGTNNSSINGFAQVILDNGYTDVTAVGFDYPDTIKEMIDSSEYSAATIIQKPYDMGYRAVQTCLDIIDGKKPMGKFVDTGVYVLTDETLRSEDIQEALSHY